jgi:hypothetical protein
MEIWKKRKIKLFTKESWKKRKEKFWPGQEKFKHHKQWFITKGMEIWTKREMKFLAEKGRKRFPKVDESFPVKEGNFFPKEEEKCTLEMSIY